MKKLIAILILLTVPLMAMSKADFKAMIAKIRKNQTISQYTPVAVAGVRGGDQSKVDKESLKKELYWEE